MQQIYVFYTQKIHPFISALSDWLIIICLICVTAVLESPNRSPNQQCIPGHTRNATDTGFLCGDQKDAELSYPYKKNTVTSAMLLILTFGPWIFTIIVNTICVYCSDATYKHSTVWKNVEKMGRMILFSCAATEALVSVIKFSVGRPRPNFFALLEQSSEEDHKQSRMSFPSGHSSLSFSLLFLLSLNLFSTMTYVQKRYKKQKPVRVSMNDPHSYFYLKMWYILRYYLLLSVIIAFIPTLIAVYIACTRVTDYWHHYSDVMAGGLIGCAGATISFMIYRDELYPTYPFGNEFKQNLITSQNYEAENITIQYDIEHAPVRVSTSHSINIADGNTNEE